MSSTRSNPAFHQRWSSKLEDRCFLSVVAPHVVSVLRRQSAALMTIKLESKSSIPRASASKSVKVWKATAGAGSGDHQREHPSMPPNHAPLPFNAKTSADTVFKVKLTQQDHQEHGPACGLMANSNPAGKSGKAGPVGIILPMTQTTAAADQIRWRDSPRLWATWMCQLFAHG